LRPLRLIEYATPLFVGRTPDAVERRIAIRADRERYILLGQILVKFISFYRHMISNLPALE
jgi:hypothetical protein